MAHELHDAEETRDQAISYFQNREAELTNQLAQTEAELKAAMDGREHGLIDNWLRHLKDIHRLYSQQIDAVQDEEARLDLLCELNVVEQVANVCHTTILQSAWKTGQEISVHGWIYSIKDGILKDLGVSVTHGEEIPSTHRIE